MNDTVELLDTPEAGVVALRGSVVRTGGYVVGLLLGLISAPLVTRHLGVVEYGQYVTVFSVVALFAGVTEGGLNAMGLREHARLKEPGRAAVMRDMLGMRLTLTTLGAVAAVAFSIGAGYDSTMVLGAVGGAIALLFLTSQDFLMVGLQGELRFGSVTTAELIRQTANTALIVALVVAGAGLLPLLWVPVPAGIVGLLMAAFLVRGRMPLRPSFDLERWRPLLRDTLPYALAVAIASVYFRTAVLVASLVTSKEQVGYFATSFRIMEMLLGIPALVLGAAFPILVRASLGDRERHTGALRRILELAFLAGVFMALVTALAAPFAVRLIAGDDFDPSIPVLRIQAIALAANFVCVAASQGLLSHGRNRSILVANICGLSATLVLNTVLASKFGAKGAAIGTAAAAWLLAAALLTGLVRGHPELYAVGRTIPPLIVAGLVGVTPALVTEMPSVLQALCGALGFAAVLAAFGRFPPELKEIVTSLRLRSRE